MIVVETEPKTSVVVALATVWTKQSRVKVTTVEFKTVTVTSRRCKRGLVSIVLRTGASVVTVTGRELKTGLPETVRVVILTLLEVLVTVSVLT